MSTEQERAFKAQMELSPCPDSAIASQSDSTVACSLSHSLIKFLGITLVNNIILNVQDYNSISVSNVCSPSKF